MADRRVIIDGLGFPESPRWHDDRFWVADWAIPEIIAVERSGERAATVPVPSSPCSFDWTPDGHLLVVSGRDAEVLRLDADRHLVPYGDLAPVTREPWNEVVVDGRGCAYVNTVGFDFPRLRPPEGNRAPGVIAHVAKDGAVREVADGLAFPNGMIVTPDGATLIVAESWANRLTAFDIGPIGDLSNRRVWAPLDGYPDGICLDAEGAVWYADVPNKRCVRVQEGGKVLAEVECGRGCFSCTLGGPDLRTLFVVVNEWGGQGAIGSSPARGRVVALRAPAPGVGRH